MGAPDDEQDRRATYADVEAQPEHVVAELIGGELHTMSRPSPRHALASTRLVARLERSFGSGDDDEPGSWIILFEPELHFGEDVLVPDAAGWRVERMPELPEASHFTLAPDWICEVLSPSTEKHDREQKMPVYERAGVPCAWLLDPSRRTLEVFTLSNEGRFTPTVMYRGDERARIEPFAAIEVDLRALCRSGPGRTDHARPGTR